VEKIQEVKTMTKLVDDIRKFEESFEKEVLIGNKKLIAQATKELVESNAAKGLSVGEQAPDFTLDDATGLSITFYEELKKGPVILTFYRGGWCPYCNLELRAYQRVLKDIKAAGGQLIAISPQTPDSSLSTKEKNELEFFVLSDTNGNVAEKYKLIFKLPDYQIEIYKQYGSDLTKHNGNDAWELPVSGNLYY